MDPSPIGVPPQIEYMAAQSAYRGRRGGLIGWGVVLIVFGAFAAFFTAMIPLMIFMLRAMPTSPGMERPHVDLRSLILAGLMYLSAAVLLIWSGVGSVRVRRWARPIILIIGWTWLLTGLATVVQMLFTMPSNTLSGPPGMLILAGVMGIFFAILVVLPAAMLRFYHRADVQETFDHFDPGPAWTDRCPTAVLGLSLGMWIAAACAVGGMLYNVVPFFGIYLTGWAGAAALLVMAALFAWGGLTTYRLQPAGWWLSMILLLLLPLSSLITIGRLGVISMYEAMEMRPEELDAMRPQLATIGPFMYIMTGAMLAAGVGYMLWIRRHFRPSAD